MAADVFDRLVALLSEAKAKFRVIEHEAEGRSEAISVIRGNRPDQAAKAMVLDVRGGGGGRRHVLAILPGNRKLDFSAVAKLFEARKCGFASPDTAQELTGCVMGSVPPFSLNPALAIVVEEDLLANDTLFFNAGRLDRSMELDTKDWLAVAQAARRQDRGAGLALPWKGRRPNYSSIMDRSSFWQRLIGWGRELKSILLAVGFVLIVRTVVAEPYHVPSPSMVPTLLTGDQLVASQVRLWLQPVFLAHRPDAGFLRAAARQDAGARRRHRLSPAARSLDDLCEAPDRPAGRSHPDEGRTALHQRCHRARRLVGPFTGDAGGRNTPTLYVETLPGGREHEIIEMSDADQHDDTPVFVVPPKHYFMMGDNRDNSVDSRIAIADGGVGFVPEDNLVGRADLVLLSRDPAVAWSDVAEWSHAFRPARLLGRIH